MDGNMPYTLRGIDEHWNTLIVRLGNYFTKRIDSAQRIRNMREGNQFRFPV